MLNESQPLPSMALKFTWGTQGHYGNKKGFYQMLVRSQRRDGSFLLAGELGGGGKFKKTSKSYTVMLQL